MIKGETKKVVKGLSAALCAVSLGAFSVAELNFGENDPLAAVIVTFLVGAICGTFLCL